MTRYRQMTALSKIRIRALRGKGSDFVSAPVQKGSGVCHEENADKNQHSIGRRFLESCQTHRKRVAISTSTDSYNYEWLLQRTSNFSASLRNNIEFEFGKHIGLHFENSIEYVVAFYGTILAGGVCVPIPKYHGRNSLKRLCHQSNVSILLDKHDGEALAEFELIDSVNLADATRHDYDTNLDEAVDSDALAMMLFTSGSSGEPKAVMLSHRNVLSNRKSIQGYLPISNQEKALAAVPFSHALGNSVLQTHVLSGAELFLSKELTFPVDVYDALRDNKCTSVSAVPEFFENLTPILENSPELPCLKYMAIAGGKANPISARNLRDAISPSDLFLMYGQTEATARLAYLPPNQLNNAAETIGGPIPGVELDVFDGSNEAATAGTIGTLHARGENIMLGYWNDCDSTNQILQNGWLNTGDLARKRSDGLIEIFGRQNGLVKVQGYRFHPVEIENTLSELLPEVPTVVVDFDFYGKSRIALFARSANDPSDTKQMLSRCCRENLPSHMIPQRIEVIAQWPTNAAGKIDRSSLREFISPKPKHDLGELSIQQAFATP